MSVEQPEKPNEERVADDILRGAAAIAAELGCGREGVYYLHRMQRYPISKLGKMLIASRRQLRRAHRILTSA
jgi:hypothetical protein